MQEPRNWWTSVPWIIGEVKQPHAIVSLCREDHGGKLAGMQGNIVLCHHHCLVEDTPHKANVLETLRHPVLSGTSSRHISCQAPRYATARLS